MIEFYGEFSEVSKKYLLKKLAKGSFLIGLILLMIFGSILFVVASVLNLWILTLFFIPLILTIILAAVAPYIYRTKTFKNMLPKKVFIDDNGYIEAEWQERSMVKTIEDVKKIIDSEECYYIIFNYPKASDIICQKNLLVKGSIEEFKKIFDGKIVIKK